MKKIIIEKTIYSLFNNLIMNFNKGGVYFFGLVFIKFI